MWFCSWKDSILLFSLPTVMSKTTSVHSYHTWFSFLFLLCLVINLKVIEAHFSQPLSWRRLWDGYIWWAENQEFLLPDSVLFLWHCCCTTSRRQEETLHGEVRETLACTSGQNWKLPFMPSCPSSYICYLDSLPNFFLSSYFSNFIFWPCTHFTFTKCKSRRSNNLVTKYGCIWTVHCWYHSLFNSDLMIFL